MPIPHLSRFRSVHLSLRLEVVLLLCVLTAVLTACGGTRADPQVASVPSTSSAPSSAGDTSGAKPSGTGAGSTAESTAGQGGRPLLRVDDTDERRANLWNSYLTCLLQNGAHKPTGDDAQPALGARGSDPGVLVHFPAPKKALAACRSLEPYGPLETEASTNPHFHEQSLRYVACLARHGEKVVLLNDHDLDWTYAEDQGPIPDGQAEFEQKCLVESFGNK